VTRRAFDLGLWTVCTALAFAIVGGWMAYEAWGGGWRTLPIVLAGTVLGGLGVGHSFYTGLAAG
jgi:hypothetical protein